MTTKWSHCRLICLLKAIQELKACFLSPCSLIKLSEKKSSAYCLERYKNYEAATESFDTFYLTLTTCMNNRHDATGEATLVDTQGFFLAIFFHYYHYCFVCFLNVCLTAHCDAWWRKTSFKLFSSMGAGPVYLHLLLDKIRTFCQCCFVFAHWCRSCDLLAFCQIPSICSAPWHTRTNSEHTNVHAKGSHTYLVYVSTAAHSVTVIDGPLSAAQVIASLLTSSPQLRLHPASRAINHLHLMNTHPRIHTHAHTVHTCAHSHIHTHTHAHTHTQTPIQRFPSLKSTPASAQIFCQGGGLYKLVASTESICHSIAATSEKRSRGNKNEEKKII